MKRKKEILIGELPIIKLIYEHYNYKEISIKLGLSVSSIEKKINKIKSFHKVKSKRELLNKYYMFNEKPNIF